MLNVQNNMLNYSSIARLRTNTVVCLTSMYRTIDIGELAFGYSLQSNRRTTALVLLPSPSLLALLIVEDMTSRCNYLKFHTFRKVDCFRPAYIFPRPSFPFREGLVIDGYPRLYNMHARADYQHCHAQMATFTKRDENLASFPGLSPSRLQHRYIVECLQYEKRG